MLCILLCSLARHSLSPCFWVAFCYFLVESAYDIRTYFKVHLTPNTISAKMQTLSCSKSDLTFFCNIWNFFEPQYNLKFVINWFTTELVRGMGLFPMWRHKLICMHVHKELIPCKWVCDVKSGIEPGLCLLGREPIDNKFQLLSVNF